MNKSYHTPNLDQPSAKTEHHNYSHNSTKLNHVLKLVSRQPNRLQHQEHKKAFFTAEKLLLRTGTTSTEYTPSNQQMRQRCSGNTM